MTKYLLHQADLTRLTVEIRGEGVAKERAQRPYDEARALSGTVKRGVAKNNPHL